jgi:hypothetical protein
MLNRRRVTLLTLLICGWNLLGVAPARTALGGSAESVDADAVTAHGSDHTTATQQYDVHEITTASGMRIREFLAPDGIVFAVTWSGPAMPDLQSLLGRSYPAYVTALMSSSQRGPQRSFRIETSDFVVETGGHMRAYSGRAYLPKAMPAGVPETALR